MTYNRILLLSLIAMGGLIVILGVWVVMDSRGPVKETWATVISSRYVEGWSTSINVNVGETSVPVTTNYPGYWIVEVDSPQLGRKEVSVAESDLLKGQTVYLDYHIGRWSGAKEIVGLRLSRGVSPQAAAFR